MRRFLNDQGELLTEPRVGSRAVTLGEVKGINRERREVTAVLSTPTPDSYDEIILPSAYLNRLSRFQRNPVLCANHVYAGPSGEPGAIGTWTNIGVRSVPSVGEALVGTCRFMENDPLAEAWWQRFLQGVVVAFSVGFITHAWENRNVTIDGRRKTVRVYTDVELIEVSAVTVPANPDALILAASADGRRELGIRPDSDLAELLGEVRGGAAPTNTTSNRRRDTQLARTVRAVVRNEVPAMLRDALAPDGGLATTLTSDLIDALRHGLPAQAALPPAPRHSRRANGTPPPASPAGGESRRAADNLDALLRSDGEPDAAEHDETGTGADDPWLREWYGYGSSSRATA